METVLWEQVRDSRLKQRNIMLPKGIVSAAATVEMAHKTKG